MTKGQRWDYAPGQFGHEYAGEVVALGKGIERLQTGSKAAVIPALGCGHCPACDHGDNPIICASPHPALGGFSEYVAVPEARSEEHTSELQSLMRISYAVFCLQK